MSIFGSIMNKIFGTTPAEAKEAPAGGAPAAHAAPGASPATGATGSVPVTVDVTAMLDDLNAKHAEDLNWRVSIVDLMKLLGLDSSLAARKQLATELHYTGDLSDSAAMNIWLHKQVMEKIAANGGKLPDDLKHH